MLIACHMLRRDQSFDIFDIQCAFRADAILCEEVVQRCAQELTINQELQGDWLLGVQ